MYTNTINKVDLCFFQKNHEHTFSEKVSNISEVLEKCPKFRDNFRKPKNCITTSHFMPFLSTQNMCLAVCQYRPCLEYNSLRISKFK